MSGARILIVDDESEIRSVLSEYLETFGFQVAVAASGAEAFSLLEAASDPFDLALVDWHLPGISGRDLSNALHTRSPQTLVIITTGDPPSSLRNQKQSSVWVDLVLKPFTLRHLRERVQLALEARGIQQVHDK